MTETEICNMALSRIGANRINDYATSATPEGKACRLHFWQSVNELLESFDWPFARARQSLSPSVDTPDFEWGYQYALPADFLSLRKNFTADDSEYVDCRWEIEGGFLMTDDSEVELKYTRKVTSINEFTPMFVGILKLHLTYNLIPAICGANAPVLTETIEKELTKKINKARTKHLQESNTSGRSDWHYARYGSRTK